MQDGVRGRKMAVPEMLLVELSARGARWRPRLHGGEDRRLSTSREKGDTMRLETRKD